MRVLPSGIWLTSQPLTGAGLHAFLGELAAQGPRPGFSAALSLVSTRGGCPVSGDLSPCPYRPDSRNFPLQSFALFECFQPDSKLMLVPIRRALSYWGITLQSVASGGSLPLLFLFRYQSDVPTLLYLPTGIFCPYRDPDVYNSDLRLISWVIGVL